MSSRPSARARAWRCTGSPARALLHICICAYFVSMFIEDVFKMLGVVAYLDIDDNKTFF